MGNCLVTKLNSVVDNDNLEKFGKLSFTAYNGKNSFLKFTQAATLKLTVGTFKDTGTTEKEIAANTEFYFTTNTVNFDEEDKIVCEFPKYTLSGIGTTGVLDVDKYFKWSESEYIEISNSNTGEGSLLNATAYTPKMGTRFVWFGNINQAFDVTNLGESGTLTQVNIQTPSANFITGSFDKLGLCPLTQMILKPSLTTLNIDNFVRNAISKGRTEYQISQNNIDALVVAGHVTLGGQVVSYGGDYSRTKVLSWEPDSTPGKTVVTLSDGASITISAVIDNTL